MRETITLTKPKKQTPITSADPDKIPVNKRTKVPPAYVYCHYEQCWEFDYVDGNGWIPLLCKIVAVPGCNGVPQSGSLSGVLQVIAQKGGTVIDPNDRKLIEPGADENTSEWYRGGGGGYRGEQHFVSIFTILFFRYRYLYITGTL